MLKIRLRRMGKKKKAFYRIVVSDSRKTPRGPFLETLGTYNPGTEPATVKLELVKIQEWIRKGAHPSDTVRSLLVQARRAELIRAELPERGVTD